MMTRREMLKLVLAGSVVGPAAVKAIITTPAPAAATTPILTGQLGAWQNVRWYTAMFDWGSKLGVAISLTDPRTGRLYRQAVRIQADDELCAWWNTCQDDAAMEPFVLPPPGVQVAKSLLSVWAEEKAYIVGLVRPPRGWRAFCAHTAPGVEDDDILEGHEMWGDLP